MYPGSQSAVVYADIFLLSFYRYIVLCDMRIIMYRKREGGVKEPRAGDRAGGGCLPSIRETPGQSSVAEEGKDSER